MRRLLRLGLEHQPLGDAEAVLLVDHHQPEVAIGRRPAWKIACVPIEDVDARSVARAPSASPRARCPCRAR